MHESLVKFGRNFRGTNVDGQVISAVSNNSQLATKGVDQVHCSVKEVGAQGVVFRSAIEPNQTKRTSRKAPNGEGTVVLLNAVASAVHDTMPYAHSRTKRHDQR